MILFSIDSLYVWKFNLSIFVANTNQLGVLGGIAEKKYITVFFIWPALQKAAGYIKVGHNLGI